MCTPNLPSLIVLCLFASSSPGSIDLDAAQRAKVLEGVCSEVVFKGFPVDEDCRYWERGWQVPRRSPRTMPDATLSVFPCEVGGQ